MNNLDLITPEYLKSQEYTNDMLTGYTGFYDQFIAELYDAEPKTNNYNIRHFELVHKLGCWRWKGIFTYRETFIDLIFNKELKGIDFGGSQRPIASHLDIVDIESTDFYGRPVKYHSLDEVDYDIDFIFSSHTLEHGGTPHVHTFKLKKTKVNEDIPGLLNIDEVIENKGFKIALAEYAGDNNIIIFAEK